MDVVVVAAVVEVFVRRARDFVVKFAEDFVCQHRNELPLTEHWPNNTVKICKFHGKREWNKIKKL